MSEENYKLDTILNAIMHLISLQSQQLQVLAAIRDKLIPDYYDSIEDIE